MGNCLNNSSATVPDNQNTNNTDNASKASSVSTEEKKNSSNEKTPTVYVICGPSGVGKGTLLKQLYKKMPDTFATAVSTTTRAPRQGEIDGTHYHFIDVNKFEEMIKNNEFLEYAKVHTNYYGTSKAAIAAVEKSNRLCILEIDRRGAINVRKDDVYGSNSKYIFVTTHDTDDVNEVIATLRERLKGRNSETEEQINTRMTTAEAELIFMQEWKKEGKWDYIEFNDDLEKASERLKNKFIEWNPHIAQSAQ